MLLSFTLRLCALRVRHIFENCETVTNLRHVGVDWEKVDRYVDMQPKLKEFANPNKECRRFMRGWLARMRGDKGGGATEDSDAGRFVTFDINLLKCSDAVAANGTMRRDRSKSVD